MFCQSDGVLTMAKSVTDLRQLSRFNGDLRRLLGSDLPAVMNKAGQRAGARFDEYVRETLPPPVRTQAAAPYWTAKQRRWWWGTMHRKARGQSKELPGWKASYKIIDGRKTLVLSGHYKRTGTLVKSLTYEVRQTKSATEVVYGSNRAYAKYVLDNEDQATYHKGNWRTLQDMAQDAAPRVVETFDDTIQAELNRRMGG